MDYEKNIEIPFGASDSELHECVYTIPEGCEAKIKDGKVIVRKAESEDDKIKKRIIHALHGDVLEMSEIKEAIAWLEKQGEQKIVEPLHFDYSGEIPIPTDPFRFNLESCIYNFGKSIAAECLDTHILDKELDEYVTDEKVREFISQYIDSLIKYHPLQKPEWSEKDKRNIKRCITKIKIDRMHWEQNGQGKTMVDADNELIAWLKSLKDRVQPQPKQEWSEEDKKFLDEAREYLMSLIGGKPDFSPHKVLEGLVEFIDKIKSFRPQNLWKPSEEQITVLHDVAAFVDYSVHPNQKDILVNLYLQLKKLREEQL